MEQRPLRLGDIVDDYCPRERRITNHVIAALMGDTVKQTRCSTCDIEHAYKAAKVPSRKKKEALPLETAVLASVNGTQLVARIDPTTSVSPVNAPPAQAPAPVPANGPAAESAPLAAASQGPDGASDDQPEALPGGWVGHRTLIRASLPRTDNEPPPARPIPEFTMYQRQTRGRHSFRNGQGGFRGHDGNRGPRGGFGHGNNGNGNEINGNSFSYSGNGHGGGGGRHHGGGQSHQNGHGHQNGQGPQPQGPGNGQGRPPGHGRRRHRHGKHRRPPQ